MDVTDWFRTMLIILVVSIAIALMVQFALRYKHLSFGQRLFVTGAICYSIYIADVTYEAIHIGLDFRLRLIALALGCLAFATYYLEPMHRRRARYGQDPMARQDKEQ